MFIFIDYIISFIHAIDFTYFRKRKWYDCDFLEFMRKIENVKRHKKGN